MAFEQYVWLIMLGGVFLNTLILWRRAGPHIAAHPELRPGYRSLIRGMTFWVSLPILVMGVGCTVGGVPWHDFFFPATGGPFVWAFWAAVYADFVLLGYWAVRRGGAEMMVRHPGLLDVRIGSVRGMRWFLGGLAVFGVVWNTAVGVWGAHRAG